MMIHVCIHCDTLASICGGNVFKWIQGQCDAACNSSRRQCVRKSITFSDGMWAGRSNSSQGNACHSHLHHSTSRATQPIRTQNRICTLPINWINKRANRNEQRRRQKKIFSRIPTTENALYSLAAKWIHTLVCAWRTGEMPKANQTIREQPEHTNTPDRMHVCSLFFIFFFFAILLFGCLFALPSISSLKRALGVRHFQSSLHADFVYIQLIYYMTDRQALYVSTTNV